MYAKSRSGLSLVEVLAGIAALASLAVLIITVIRSIEERGRSHPATTESFKAAGMALCEELHGGTPMWATCVNQVLTEWARALGNQDAFNTGAVPSIPPARWP
jgi:hypothetical protein